MGNARIFMATEGSNSEQQKTTLVLSVVAKMFRQHADLFEQQAAVLERIATDPTVPSSWATDEPSPESLQRQLIRENTTAVAIKSYESMLQVQKRIDYLERLMTRNGIQRIHRKPSSAIPTTKSFPNDSKTAFYWFKHDHAPAIAKELGISNTSDNRVRQKLLKLWAAMNPHDRMPFWQRAQEFTEKGLATKTMKRKSSTIHDKLKQGKSSSSKIRRQSIKDPHQANVLSQTRVDPSDDVENDGNNLESESDNSAESIKSHGSSGASINSDDDDDDDNDNDDDHESKSNTSGNESIEGEEKALFV